MNNYYLTLTQSLNAKLCSDFANQASVIGNSAELIESGNDRIKEEALSIVGKASQKMVDLLEIYRYSYSVVDPLKVTDVREIKELIEKYLRTEGIKVETSLVTKEDNLGYIYGKIILCFLLSLSPQSIRDSFVEFNLEHLNEIRFRIIFKQEDGEKSAQIFEELNLDNNRAPQINPSNCRGLYLKEIVRDKGYVSSVKKFPGVVEYSLDRIS